MNIEKIEINGHYVWVDKDAEIKENNWYIGFEVNYATEPKERWVIYNCGVGANGNPHYKIIAASPELNLEGVPTYPEWLANKTYPETYYSGIYVDGWSKAGFIKGYQTAEKELQKQLITEIMNDDAKDGLYEPQPTWDDVRKAIELAREGMRDYTEVSENQIIEQLKQSKK